MMRHRLMLPKWGPVINSLEQLITNAAALESLLEGALQHCTPNCVEAEESHLEGPFSTAAVCGDKPMLHGSKYVETAGRGL